MRTNNDIKQIFSAQLRECLRTRYGKIPSAAVIARDFNLRAYGTQPISQESARRWIRGVSLPEEDRLRVLVNWLNLDFNNVLRSDDVSTALNNFSHPNSMQIRLSDKNNETSSRTYANGHSKLDQEIIDLMFTLDEEQKNALSELIKIAFTGKNIKESRR